MDAHTIERGPGAVEAAADRAAGAEDRLAAAAERIFGPRLKAAWLSGSFVYDGARPGRSDIDVVLLVDEGAAVPADEAMLAAIRAFVDEYLAVHARLGLDPDLDFPGEYVAPATLKEAIAWRGLALDGGIAERFPPVESPDYWLGRPDRWFHAWLSMTAFSRFLAGSRPAWEAAKLAAWRTVARFVLLRSGQRAVAADALWEALGQFGVKPRYRAFRALERPWLKRALAGLEAEGEVAVDGERIVPDPERLGAWRRRVEAAIARAGGTPGPLLLDPGRHRTVEAHSARRWRDLAGG